MLVYDEVFDANRPARLMGKAGAAIESGKSWFWVNAYAFALRHVSVNKKSHRSEKLLRRKGYSADGGCAHVIDSVAGVDVKTGMLLFLEYNDCLYIQHIS